MIQTGTRVWQLPGRTISFAFGDLPRLMGIVNVTPDSFSDGGRYLDPDRAVAHALELIQQGADFLDVGGESTRPGSQRVPLEEELRRVIPVIERLAAKTTVPISVDTSKAEVARQALSAGALIVNDVTGLEGDAAMLGVCAGSEAGVVCMHMQGTPETMQDHPSYGDVVAEVAEYLRQRLAALERGGIPAERVVVDPGIGFGKTARHNLQILSHVARFRELGRPLLIGHSRKRFLKALLGRPVEEAAAGTLGVSLALAAQSAEILRVHDVGAVRDALVAWQAVLTGQAAVDEAGG